MLSLVPQSVETEEELQAAVSAVEAEIEQRQDESRRLLFANLREHYDPTVRELAALTEDLLEDSQRLREQLTEAKDAADAATRRADEADARTDKALEAARNTVALSAKLAETNERLQARLDALNPSEAVQPDAILAKAPEIGTLAKPDSRSGLRRATDAYLDAWKEHPLLMGAGHLGGFWMFRAIRDGLQAAKDRDAAEDANDDLWDHLMAQVEQNESLSAEVEDQAQAVSEAQEQARLAASPTTEVHVHESPRLDEEQFKALSGRVDRAVQSEMRTNAKRYRGEKGAPGRDGKAGRDGRNAKTVRTTQHVHHHTTTHLKSEAKPQRTVEVRHTTHVIKPTQKVGPMAPSTQRLIAAMDKLKGSK